MQSTSPFFSNFTGPQLYWVNGYEFQRNSDLGPWDWYGAGHTMPMAVDNIDGGGVLLGSGSANAGDYIQMQETIPTIVPTRLGKEYDFEWKVSLNSATLTEFTCGAGSANTALLTTVLANGFGFYANLSGGLPSGYWNWFIANGAGTQFSGYDQQSTGIACTTGQTTLLIRYTTDTQSAGGGSMTFFVNGQQAPGSVTGLGLFPQVPLSLFQAMGNSTGVAQSAILYTAAVQAQV